MKKILFVLLMLTYSSMFAATKPVVIDTDASTDDAIAILYLLNQNTIDIKAIIVDKNGASSANTAASHIASILQLANKPNIPIYLGLDKKPTYGNTYPDIARTLIDGSFSQNLLKPTKQINRNQLIDIIKQTYPEVLSLGSLTNLADIIPETKSHISKMVIMGGAIDVPGNIDAFVTDTKNKYAEWNIYVDPDAFKTVLASGIQITMVSLDITNKTELTEKFLQKLHQQKTINAQFVYQLLLPSNDYIKRDEYDFWDPLAAYVLVNGAETASEKINVVTTRNNHFGQIYQTSTGYPVDVVTQIDTLSLETALLQGM